MLTLSYIAPLVMPFKHTAGYELQLCQGSLAVLPDFTFAGPPDTATRILQVLCCGCVLVAMFVYRIAVAGY